MVARPLFVLVIAGALVLSGCLAGKTEEPVSTTALDPKPGAEGVGNATGSAPIDDGKTNMSTDLGHMPHLHDYWDGKERVTLFDGEVPFQFDGLFFSTFYSVFVMRQPGMFGGAFFEFPDGATVYEGTGLVEVTATWSDPKVTGLSVAYATPANRDFSELAPLSQGTAFQIPVTPDMTDMPHMSTSRWSFAFLPNAAPGAVLGPFHLKVDIVKMRDIGLFPGHPELFNGAHEKVVLDKDGKSTTQNFLVRFANAAVSGEWPEEELTPDAVVPMETQAMVVELTIKSASAQLGEVSNLYLYYRGADTWRYQGAEKVSGSVAEQKMTFLIPVEMKQTDSPYAKESQWRFGVQATTSPPAAQGDLQCGACVDSQVEYHMKVTALDHSFEPAS